MKKRLWTVRRLVRAAQAAGLRCAQITYRYEFPMTISSPKHGSVTIWEDNTIVRTDIDPSLAKRMRPVEAAQLLGLA